MAGNRLAVAPGQAARRVTPAQAAGAGACSSQDTVAFAIEVNKQLLGGHAVHSSSVIDDCLDVARRQSVWLKCTGGKRAGQWREVWPFACVLAGGTEMARFRCFEDERHTICGRKTWYDMCLARMLNKNKIKNTGGVRL